MIKKIFFTAITSLLVLNVYAEKAGAMAYVNITNNTPETLFISSGGNFDMKKTTPSDKYDQSRKIYPGQVKKFTLETANNAPFGQTSYDYINIASENTHKFTNFRFARNASGDGCSQWYMPGWTNYDAYDDFACVMAAAEDSSGGTPFAIDHITSEFQPVHMNIVVNSTAGWPGHY